MSIINRFRKLFSTSQQFFNKLSQPKFAELTNRSILRIEGPDTRKLLQGIVTNNIDFLYSDKKENESRAALYTMFLNSKGKVITDAFIVRPRIFKNRKIVAKEDELWIETDKEMSVSLQQHIKKYTWKKDVRLQNLLNQDEQNKPKIYAGYTSKIQSSLQNKEERQMKEKVGHLINSDNSVGEDEQYANMIFLDPRNSFLGVRIFCSPSGFQYSGQKQEVDVNEYDFFTTNLGIASSKIMKNRLPFMFNADLFNAFSFNKGCFLGQQIISRSYFTGIVRRRVFPYILQKQETIPEGTILKDQNKNELGKVLESREGGGIVASNYLGLMDKDLPLRIEYPSRGVLVMPLKEELNEYLKEMREKQQKLLQIDL